MMTQKVLSVCQAREHTSEYEIAHTFSDISLLIAPAALKFSDTL